MTANDTRSGLAGTVWTGDVSRPHRVVARLRAGTEWINGDKSISVAVPFGGHGVTGHGRTSGREALMAPTQTKAVWLDPRGGLLTALACRPASGLRKKTAQMPRMARPMLAR